MTLEELEKLAADHFRRRMLMIGSARCNMSGSWNPVMHQVANIDLADMWNNSSTWYENVDDAPCPDATIQPPSEFKTAEEIMNITRAMC